MRNSKKFNAILGLVALGLSLLSAPVYAELNNSGFAVVLIDMQKGFFERGHATDTPELKNLIDHQVVLLEWAVTHEIPVLIFEYDTFGDTDPRLMAPLSHHPFEKVTKYEDNGFGYDSSADALAHLKRWNVDTLIVAGINGGYCVKSTALGGIQAGFDVMTSSDIVGNVNENPPIYPNDTWFFKGKKFVVFENLSSIIN
jgi:nicotinamidase-related amidase